MKKLMVALVMALMISVMSCSTANAATKTMFGDTLIVKEKYMSKGANTQPWSDWEDGVLYLDERNPLYANIEHPRSSDWHKLKPALGKKVGDTFTMKYIGGDGDYTYKYKIVKIEHPLTYYNKDGIFRVGRNAVKQGRYIYYSYNMRGVRMGIKRFDTKTKKVKTICGYKYKGKETNGFSNLNIKGKYIYCEYNRGYGSDSFNCYICRINIKTGKIKTLAKGEQPVLYKNNIYYFKQRHIEGFPWRKYNLSTKKIDEELVFATKEEHEDFEFFGSAVLGRFYYYDRKKKKNMYAIEYCDENGKVTILQKWDPAE